jgi:translocation and assembly module TamA
MPSKPSSSPPSLPFAVATCSSTPRRRTITSSSVSPEPWRRAALAFAVSFSLVAQPIAAQQAAEPELKDLIPDEAVANPEEWARRGVPPDANADTTPEPDPTSPLAEGVVDLPDPEQIELPQLAPLTPEPDIQFAEFEDFEKPVQMGSEERISDELVLVFPSEASLFPERDEFLKRFKQLSTIEKLDDEDSAAKLAAQARADEQMLLRLLRVYGYYDAVVSRQVAGLDAPAAEADTPATAEKPQVRFNILPGKQYAFGAVDLGQLADAGPDYPMLRETFEIKTGDPLLADKILEEQFDLDRQLGETGYPFAKIDDPSLLVDHARTQGDLTLPVTPGGKYNFGQVTSNMPEFMSGRHLADIARFEPGDLYKRSLDLDLRQAILATGIVSSVTITPVATKAPADGQPGTVDMQVQMEPAKLRTLAGRIGYGTGEGFKIEGSWEHRNLFPPEGMLRVRGIAGTNEQLAGVTFRKNNFHARDQILTIDAFASTIDYDAYDARTVSLVGNFERVSTVLFQKPFSWSVGLELTATGERQADANGNLGPRQTYFIGAIPLYAQLDTSDDLLNPTRGWRLGAHVSPETSRTNDVQSFYVRSQVDASYYRSLGEKVVLAGRVRLGSITGADLAAIAPSRRLYAGGGGSVRGYGYRAIGPHDDQGDPTGGRSLTELAIEARIKTGWLGGALQIVPFVDAGTVGENELPGFDQIKIGAGIGARYLTGFGPIRLDVAVPLNPGPNDDAVAVYVGLGQAF